MIQMPGWHVQPWGDAWQCHFTCPSLSILVCKLSDQKQKPLLGCQEGKMEGVGSSVASGSQLSQLLQNTGASLSHSGNPRHSPMHSYCSGTISRSVLEGGALPGHQLEGNEAFWEHSSMRERLLGTERLWVLPSCGATRVCQCLSSQQ